jgi:LTXXQ motif family protein
MRFSATCALAPIAALAVSTTIGVAAQSRGSDGRDQATILGPANLQPGAADLACGTGPAGLGPWSVEHIQQDLSLDEDQIAKFNALKTASQKALQYLKESCPTGGEPVTPTARLDVMQQRLEAMLEAVREVRPALADFYGSLNDEQKARLNILDPTIGPDRADQVHHRVVRHRGHFGFPFPFRFPF